MQKCSLIGRNDSNHCILEYTHDINSPNSTHFLAKNLNKHLVAYSRKYNDK